MNSQNGKCPACGHKEHDNKVCRKMGRVECRRIATPQGTALVRGQFQCGCDYGVPVEVRDAS